MENRTGRAPLTDAERIILWTQRLIAAGKPWSRAMMEAENIVYGPPPKGYEAGETHWSDRKRRDG